MKSLITFFAAIALITTACGDGPTPVAREIGEEGAELVKEIGPRDDDEAPTRIPPAHISIDETLGAISGERGILGLAPAMAIDIIDKWMKTLAGNTAIDDSDRIVEELLYLKKLLLTTPIDADEVSDVLESLAEQTEDAAEEAENVAVEKLAELLDDASDALD